MINPMDLTGKRILITGASSGIGRETAILISKLGAQAIILARNEERLLQTKGLLVGENHQHICCDLRNVEGIEPLIQGIISRHGKIDGLAYCAGYNDDRPLQAIRYPFVRDMMTVNYYAFLEVTRIISKKRNINPAASIVVVSSMVSIRGNKGQTVYAATKAALDSTVRCMAKELADKGIRVNSVLPGFIRTDMYEEYIKNYGEAAFEKNFATEQYLGLGEPIDVANVIAFLLSKASKFITGTSLLVNGGMCS